MRAWTSPDGYIDTRFDLIKAVKAAFEREGLTFAYPHQVAVETRPWTPPDRERQRRRLRATSPAGRQGRATAAASPHARSASPARLPRRD